MKAHRRLSASVLELGAHVLEIFDEMDSPGRIAMGLVLARIGFAQDMVLARVPRPARKGILAAYAGNTRAYREIVDLLLEGVVAR